MATLSVVIPTMNEEDYLPDFFRTLAAQTLQPDEVVVADAHSTDSTRAIAERFGARVVDGGMPGVGRNRGAKAAKGELIFFFDADVELRDRTFLKRALEDFQRQELDLATADIIPIDAKKFDNFAHWVYNGYVRFTANVFPHAAGACMLVRRAMHERLGGFDESIVFAEDEDYARRVSRIGRFGILSRPLTIHVSVRRLEREGRILFAVKYLFSELHLRIIGPIRHNKFNYTFGHPKRKKK